MTDYEKITMVKTIVENDAEATDAVISTYLKLAQSKILSKLYPFGTSIEEIPEAYAVLQCELAARYFLRRGGEGEISHSENGINRTYKSVDDEDILNRIVSYAEVR